MGSTTTGSWSPNCPSKNTAREVTSSLIASTSLVDARRGAELGPHPCRAELVHLPRCVKRQQPRRLNLGMRQGDVVLHHLMLTQQLPVRRAGNGALAHDVERALRLTEPAHRVVNAPTTETLLGEHETGAGRPDEVVERHPAVTKDDLGMIARTPIHRVG